MFLFRGYVRTGLRFISFLSLAANLPDKMEKLKTTRFRGRNIGNITLLNQ